MKDGSKSETLNTRRDQGACLSGSDQNSSGGIGSTGRTPGNEPLRTGGTNRTGAYPSQQTSLNGGILAQLIRQAKDQLAEAKACIEWYEAQIVKTSEYLDSLKQLQELEEQQRQPEVTQSEEEQ